MLFVCCSWFLILFLAWFVQHLKFDVFCLVLVQKARLMKCLKSMKVWISNIFGVKNSFCLQKKMTSSLKSKDGGGIFSRICSNFDFAIVWRVMVSIFFSVCITDWSIKPDTTNGRNGPNKIKKKIAWSHVRVIGGDKNLTVYS